MAYWIVYQGKSWERAREGGYLWAPKLSKNGQSYEYWRNMARVRPGDLIFSGVDNAIRAVSQASALAYDATRPDRRDEEFWDAMGWRLDVVYSDTPEPLYYRDWVPQIFAELPVQHSPFSRTMGPNQGYLYEVPLSVGEHLLDLIRVLGLDIDAQANEAALPPKGGETERALLGKARIGQGKFRQDLIDRWNGRCALTGVDRRELLRASHIKPWSGSNNEERLDPCNGFLLSAAYDAAFDAKLISFADDGSMVLAEDFSVDDAQKAGINPELRLQALTDMNRQYLAEHRQLLKTREKRLEARNLP